MLAATSIDEIAATVFIDLALIVVAARLMGMVAKKLGQPAVIGEIIAGVLLGPSLLGAFPGDLPNLLFPPDVRPFLKLVAQLGLILFMFIVGLELDLRLIRRQERAAAVISLSSIALPFGLGILLATALHSSHQEVGGTTVAFTPFALFIGVSMSITAFPVLARILIDRGMLRTKVGVLTLTCAAIDDVVAWSMLALVLAIVASTGAGDLPRILVESLVFVAGTRLVVKPALEHVVARRYRERGQLTPGILALVLAGILTSSYLTAQIGIHQIFGAFLFGTAIPRMGDLRRDLLERMETMTVLLLLPVFFVVTGLEADVRGIGLDGIPQLGLILLVACTGKFVGATLAARSQRIGTRQAATIGILMNTRGLTELVILNVGLAFGVLDRELFTMLLVMAIVTTVMTAPLLRLVYPDTILARDRAETERATLSPPGGYRVLIAVGTVDHARLMTDLAADLVRHHQPAEIVLTRFTPRAEEIDLDLDSGLVGELEEMRASMSTLQELARHVESRGVKCAVLYQFSHDVAGELVAQTANLQPELLLVGGPRAATLEGRVVLDEFCDRLGLGFDAFLRRVFAEAPCDVGVLVHPAAPWAAADPQQPAVVALGDARNDPAALDLAVRLARSRTTCLRVVDQRDGRRGSRQLASLVQEVDQLGVRCVSCVADGGLALEVAHQAVGAGIVVMGASAPEMAGGAFGPVPDEVVRSVAGPILVVRGREGPAGSGMAGVIERLHRSAPHRPAGPVGV